MKLSEVRDIIRQVIAEAKEEKGSGLPKSGGKLVHLKKELDGLKKMKESLGSLQIAEGGEAQPFVAEYAHMQKFVNELEKIKAAHAKLAEMLDNQISEVEGKVSSETNKIKELMGLIEKAPKEKKEKKEKKTAHEKGETKAEEKEEHEKEEPKKKSKDLEESFASLEKKIEKSGKSKEAATKIAGAVANAKMHGAGKGPTAKQKARMAEAAFSSSDVNAILKAARAAVEAGKTVTVNGKAISKVVPGLGRFIPADGSPSIKIMDYVGTPEKIVIDGKPAELKPMEPSKPQPDTRTPEEKAKAQAAFNDRYGPNGGYDTAFGRYTGD